MQENEHQKNVLLRIAINKMGMSVDDALKPENRQALYDKFVDALAEEHTMRYLSGEPVASFDDSVKPARSEALRRVLGESKPESSAADTPRQREMDKAIAEVNKAQSVMDGRTFPSHNTPQRPEGKNSIVTPEMDRAYLDAVERADDKTASQAIDSALEILEGSRDSSGKYQWIKSIPSVGFRVGDIPESGKSFNTRDNRYEDGVSLIKAGALPETKSFAISALKDSRARIVYVRGDVLTRTGGDDEFVMSNARAISKSEYESAIRTDEQAVSDYILSGAKWDLAGRAGSSSVEKWIAANKDARSRIQTTIRDASGRVIPLSERFASFDRSAPDAQGKPVIPEHAPELSGTTWRDVRRDPGKDFSIKEEPAYKSEQEFLDDYKENGEHDARETPEEFLKRRFCGGRS